MFCSQCGTANADGAQFFSKCGAALNSVPASTNPAPAVPCAALQPPVCPAQSSGKALASLIFGLFFFVCPAAVVAIVFGHLSLSEIRKSAGRLTDRGMAMAGLILSYIGIAIIPFVLIVAAIAIPNLLRAKIAANQAGASARFEPSWQPTRPTTRPTEMVSRRASISLTAQAAVPLPANTPKLLDHALASGQKNGYAFTYVRSLLPICWARDAQSQAQADSRLMPIPSTVLRLSLACEVTTRMKRE